VDPAEILVPSVATRVQVVGKDDYEFTFQQKPLTFFGKLDFFAVLGRALDRAMTGPTGISVGDLLDTPERSGNLIEDVKDADTFVRGVAKLISYAPEIVGDLYCTILNVPRGQREIVKEIFELDEEKGGLSDADGAAILDTFFDQNWEVLRDFFKEQIAPLAEKAGSKMKSPPSQS
jgi:hypothetical protein